MSKIAPRLTDLIGPPERDEAKAFREARRELAALKAAASALLWLQDYMPHEASCGCRCCEATSQLRALATPASGARTRMSDEFTNAWRKLTENQRARVRAKAQWEHMSLLAVLREWTDWKDEPLEPPAVTAPAKGGR